MAKAYELSFSSAKIVTLFICLILLSSEIEASRCKVNSKKVIGKNVHLFLEETYAAYLRNFGKNYYSKEEKNCHFAIYLTNLKKLVYNRFQYTNLPWTAPSNFDMLLIWNKVSEKEEENLQKFLLRNGN